MIGQCVDVVPDNSSAQQVNVERNSEMSLTHHGGVEEGDGDLMSPVGSENGIGSDVECFQNYTAPEVFTQGLAGMVNQQDVHTIIRSQKYM